MRTNDDIDWLLNQSPGLLGERGLSSAPGSKMAVDPGAYHDAMIRALPHVARQRFLGKIWSRLNAFERAVLECRYAPRQHVGVFGARVAFGELAALALWLAEDQQALCRALSRQCETASAQLVSKALRRAEAADLAAHKAFDTAQRELEREWVTEGDE